MNIDQPTVKELLKKNESLDKEFISVWDNIIPPDICKFIINFAENTKYIDERNDRNKQDKQAALHIFHPMESDILMQYVNACAVSYCDKYPYLKNFPYHSSSTLVQKTKPKQGYHYFHCEDSTWTAQTIGLAWMVYLNDVTEGGETEFLYQQLKIKPKAGRVVIWPGSFTHQHRGNPPMSDKYIVTGWYANALGIEKRIFDPMAPLDLSPTPR